MRDGTRGAARRRVHFLAARLLAFGLVCASLPGAAVAGEDPLPTANARLVRQELVPALEKLASWCNSKKLYGQRSATYETILRFAPDHGDARRGLKYKRGRDSGWVAPAKPYLPKDRNKRALADLPDKRSQLLASFRDAMLELLDERGLNPWDEQGRALLDDVLEVLPDDETVRALLGELKVGDRWVLEECAAAQLRRERLATVWEEALALARSDVQEDGLTREERTLEAEWTAVFASEEVRVLGSGELAEIVRAAEVNHALGHFFRSAFDCRAHNRHGAKVFLLADPREVRAFLASYPDLTRDERDFYEELVGAGMPGGVDVAQWARAEEGRLDGAAQHTIHGLMRRAFQVTDEHGWAWQGLGLHLTWRTIGTRLTRNIASAREDSRDYDALRHLMYSSAADWISLASEHLFDGRGLDLERVLGKSADAMSTRDVLTSYVLAAYLLEGRDELPEILRAIGRGTESEIAVTDALGMDLPELEWRLRRWVDAQEIETLFDHTVLVAAVERPVRRVTESAAPALLGVAASGTTPASLPIALSSFQEKRLLARIAKLAPKKSRALVDRCLAAARASGAPQAELIDEWLAGAELDLDDLPAPTEFPAHDPDDFRGGTERRPLAARDARLREVRESLPAAELPRRARAVDYEFATGQLVAGTPRGASEELAELLDGRLPAQDLARARVLAALDRSRHLGVDAECFAHLYTDRDGNAYPGVTLFDMWSSGVEMDVPDLDVRAYAALVWKERKLPIPLEEGDQQLWYPRMVESALALRAHQERLRFLAEVWFQGSVDLPREYEAGIDALHGAVVLGEKALRARLEGAPADAAGFLEQIEAEIDRSGNATWNAAYDRREELDHGADRIRAAVLEVLDDERLLDR